MKQKQIKVPFSANDLSSLRAGDFVLLSGTIFTARDAAHKRLIEGWAAGIAPPIDLQNQVIYYVGPAPAKAGHVIGPAGPTTSVRMDPYTLPLLERGVKGLIGKGYRGATVKAALVRHKAIYFAAIGGAAALLSKQIQQSAIVAYADLGTEAIRKLDVIDFPLIVVHDCLGGDAYKSGQAKFACLSGEE